MSRHSNKTLFHFALQLDKVSFCDFVYISNSNETLFLCLGKLIKKNNFVMNYN